MAVNIEGLANQIVAQAAQIGGETWQKIQKAAPLYAKGYVHALANIAAGVLKGEISKADAKMYASDARLLMVMGIANTSHIILVQVQKFMDGVISTLRTTINAALPIAVL